MVKSFKAYLWVKFHEMRGKLLALKCVIIEFALLKLSDFYLYIRDFKTSTQ